MSGTDLARLRELNSLTVVRALRDQPPTTVTELAGLTGLSRPAVDVIARGLVSSGWATVVEPGGSSTVGRPARRYRFRATAGHVLGVDVGGHKILALIADLDGNVVHTSRIAVAPDADPAQRLAKLDQILATCLRDAAMTAQDIWAVTVGVTGPVDATGKTTLFTPLPGWQTVDLPTHLSDPGPTTAPASPNRTDVKFTCPVLVENDCKLAAL